MEQPKPKPVNVEIIPPTNDAGEERQPYRIMHELIAEHHQHLAEAKIALAWRFGWSKDKDGRLKLGQCRKASDLDAALHGYDFIVLLNHEAWNAASFTEKQMAALIDHELCHAQVTIADDGEVKMDSTGRPVWRMRGHDVEEFNEIVKRHGLWTSGLEAIAQAAVEHQRTPLLRVAQ